MSLSLVDQRQNWTWRVIRRKVLIHSCWMVTASLYPLYWMYLTSPVTWSASRDSSPAWPQEQRKWLQREEGACRQIKSTCVRWEGCGRLSWEEEEVTDTSTAGSWPATSLGGSPGNKEQGEVESFDCTYCHLTPSVGTRQLYLATCSLVCSRVIHALSDNLYALRQSGYFLADKPRPGVCSVSHLWMFTVQRLQAIGFPLMQVMFFCCYSFVVFAPWWVGCVVALCVIADLYLKDEERCVRCVVCDGDATEALFHLCA